ncbi:IS30 family transposase [Pseudomarimonas arenosa]|uniref:IS30 family transposase n=1 Tax=Pseudomarimonas arenosa TaxID=2774145 RepID=A0AAW3ZRG4_9GAMM|nr:IS30 family transposase [Pseudomarimonas arenosa]MBD8528293.1 IS30 family transposase [Pseudomarimonas arenosa]
MYYQLTQDERYLISQAKRSGMGVCEIARLCGRSPSTISRELKRNLTAHDGIYRAERAQSYATARRRRCRRGSQFGEHVHASVVAALTQQWSPAQIVGAFSKSGLEVPSHETIYRWIRRDRRAGGQLYKHTRIMSKVGRKRYRSRPARGILLGKRHISERPRVVDARRRLGDWEGDTVMGRGSRHCLLTLIERKSRFTVIRKLMARTASEVVNAFEDVVDLGEFNFKTMTLDNGTEFHSYKELEVLGELKCYFSTPYHSWERGTNENANGLIRQYLPKGKCLRNITQEDCDWIANRLNERPRKCLGFKTPKEVYYRS